MQTTNILIIGAGILSLTIARKLLQEGAEDILIIDKEPSLALHASGRNSGVMHAGIYYAGDSLKARYCLKGNLAMQAYCQERGLPINHCGKVVVAKNAEELATLHVLYERAQANGAKVDLIDEQQLAAIEPWAKTHEQAIYSHYTAVVDPKKIMSSLYDELLASKKVTFSFNTCFLQRQHDNEVITNQGSIHYQYLINAAGSYADTVAKHFGLAEHLIMMPFKGIYRKLHPDQAHRITGNIYPVPNIANPFLGVHFTKNIHGDVYAGPTAIPAFGRENYGLIKGVDREAWSITRRSIQLFIQNKKFRQVALTEPRKYIPSYFYRSSKSLVKELKQSWLLPSNKAGIRPQLIDWRSKELVMDFMLERTDNSLHLLNAISPAFTSSMAVADDVVAHYITGTQNVASLDS